MVVAELEVWHSRPVAPTRRVALGHMTLPVDPPPGFGGILLGGIVAQYVGALDPDLLPDLTKLTTQLENDLQISQPRLRYRLQRDKIGLQRSHHRLHGEGDELWFDFDDEHGLPAQQLLGAVYAAGQLPMRARSAVMGTIRRAIGWQGPIGPELISALAGFTNGSEWSTKALSHPVEWALGVLGFDERTVAAATASGNGSAGKAAAGTGGGHGSGAGHGSPRVSRLGVGPSRSVIQRRYRERLIEAHPDHGAHAEGAAQRIADLSEARRILLG